MACCTSTGVITRPPPASRARPRVTPAPLRSSGEAAILGGLEGHLPSTTTVIVASRLATIALADRVLYLEDGHLAADGDHQTLLATTPGYARLVRAYEQAERKVRGP